MLNGRDGLAAVFTPRRVALVGASDRAGSVGRLLWDTLAGFPGEVVPVDGMVESDEAIVDESALTGEPLPVTIHRGGNVRSGTAAAPQDAVARM